MYYGKVEEPTSRFANHLEKNRLALCARSADHCPETSSHPSMVINRRRKLRSRQEIADGIENLSSPNIAYVMCSFVP